jgi:hypothetical protein
VEQDIQRRSGSGPDIQLSKNEGRARNGLFNIYIGVQAFRYKVRNPAMNPLFPTPQKGNDLISTYSPGIHGFLPMILKARRHRCPTIW